MPENEIWVNSDPTLFKQILLNIISNAIKHTPFGSTLGINLHILEHIEGHIKCQISISYSGRGLSMKETSGLFSPHSPVTLHNLAKYDSSGLSLSISNGLTQLLGGTIKMENIPGSDNIFYLAFNFEVGFKPEPPLSRERVGSIVSLSKERKKILIVDDNIINQKVLKRILERSDFQCQIANDGQEAIELYQSFTPDLIFMDLEMPRKNGLQAIKEIRELEIGKQTSVPIYVITCYAREEYNSASQQAGANGFITKPIKPSIIFEILEKHFEVEKISEEIPAHVPRNVI